MLNGLKFTVSFGVRFVFFRLFVGIFLTRSPGSGHWFLLFPIFFLLIKMKHNFTFKTHKLTRSTSVWGGWVCLIHLTIEMTRNFQMPRFSYPLYHSAATSFLFLTGFLFLQGNYSGSGWNVLMGWNNSSFSVRKEITLTSKKKDANKQFVTVAFCGN